ncbi:hypothetical protein ACFFUE_06070 [Bergeyella porcorum]|uniref:hypothetical protein n=1 Tax=Bergeyella porcorum TaxID=1735111 RepID=UPI0035E929A8
MKRKFILVGLLVTGLASAQDGRVGINTMNPKAALEVSRHDNLPTDQSQGVMFPSFSTEEREQWTDTQEGTMIYNTTKKCLEMYFGVVNGVHQWNCIPDVGSSQSQNISVAPAGFTGAYIGGVPLSSTNTVKFKLVNNSFFPVNNINLSNAVSIVNGGSNVSVNGAAHNNVSLASGAETTLSYILSGTPELGTLIANFDRLGLTATQSTQVGYGSATFLPENITYVLSLVYNTTTIQGKINNTNPLKIRLPYTSGQGSYAAFSNTQPTAEGQNNDTNQLTLSIPQGNFGVSGVLEGTITVDGDGEYLVKLLSPGEEYVIATFPVDINGSTTQVVIKGVGGIPDKKFNEQTFGQYNHRFVYLPMQGPDGKMWLSNNLGAEYSRVDSPYFDINRQAGALDAQGNPIVDPTTEQIKKDYRAYGSLYEFGRNSDGHELINWSSATTGTLVYSNQNSNHYNPANYTLANDPCPSGWHTPALAELRTLHSSITGSTTISNTNKMWTEKDLKLPAAGFVNVYGKILKEQSIKAFYRTSQGYNALGAWDLRFTSTQSTVQGSDNYWYLRPNGFPIRCIKD